MLIVTRPREQSTHWVQRLRGLGVHAVAVPLLGIEPAADPQPLRAAAANLAQWRAVLFVSPNAVSHFFAAQASGSVTWPASTWAAAPGPGTVESLLQQGVPASCILQPPADAANFDSESLWPVLAPLAWQGSQVLIVRGQGGREWLAEQWQARGAHVDYISAYRRAAPRLNEAELSVLDTSLREPASAAWLFSSSEALAHLPPLAAERAQHLGLPAHPGVPAWAARVPAWATHPRIVEQAHRLGFVQTQACRPSVEEVAKACAAYNAAHRDA